MALIGVEAADRFSVPSGQTWTPTRVTAQGFQAIADGDTGVRVRFYDTRCAQAGGGFCFLSEPNQELRHTSCW